MYTKKWVFYFWWLFAVQSNCHPRDLKFFSFLLLLFVCFKSNRHYRGHIAILQVLLVLEDFRWIISGYLDSFFTWKKSKDSNPLRPWASDSKSTTLNHSTLNHSTLNNFFFLDCVQVKDKWSKLMIYIINLNIYYAESI